MDEVTMLMLAGGVSSRSMHPLFCLLIVLAVVHAFACRTPRAAPPVPKCGKPVTKALRNVNVKRRSPPKVAYDLDERVASQPRVVKRHPTGRRTTHAHAIASSARWKKSLKHRGTATLTFSPPTARRVASMSSERGLALPIFFYMITSKTTCRSSFPSCARCGRR